VSEVESLPVEKGRICGTANIQLTPENMAELGAALGTLLGEGALVVTARDYYPPSRMLKRAFSAGLMSVGITVMDFHGATLPELAFSIKRFGAKAGIQFTVSPYRENDVNLKILDSTGAEFTTERLNELIQLYETKHIIRTIPKRIGWVSYAEYIHDIYVASLTSFLDINPIFSFSPKVVVDTNFGPSSEVLPDFLSEIGVNHITLNSHKPPIHKSVSHLPPIESLFTLSKIVIAAEANLGAAFSADASRIVLIDDRGKVLSPDETAAILVSFLPENSRISISYTMSSLVDKVAEQRKIKVSRVKGLIGDVSRHLKRIRAIFGAIDSGEFIFPQFSIAPDALLTLGKIIESLSLLEVNLSKVRNELPEINKYSIEVDLGEVSPSMFIEYVVNNFENIILTVTGVKIVLDDTWVYIDFIPERNKFRLTVEEPTSHKINLVKKLADNIRKDLETLPQLY